MARKPKYNEEIHNKIIQLIEKGYIDKEVCKSVNINISTYYEWQDEKSNQFKSELTDSIKKAKNVIDQKVEQKLFKRAMGFKVNEVTKEIVTDLEGNTTLQVTKIVTKEVVPDVGAQIFWLKNRQPDRWRDTKNIVNTIEDPLNKMLEISKKLKGE
jgi:hypothetical protein